MYVVLLEKRKASYVAVNLVVIAACQLWQPSGDDGAAQWFQMTEMLPTIISLDEGSRILSKRVSADSHNFRFRSRTVFQICVKLLQE
jgi:hypothetical protein